VQAQATYEWLLAQKQTLIKFPRERDAMLADLARLRRVLDDTVEGLDVASLFPDVLADAVHSSVDALTLARIAGPADGTTQRILLRLARLELLELTRADLQVHLPPCLQALERPLSALSAAMAAAPELERKACASALAAQAEVAAQGGPSPWDLNHSRVENGPCQPAACASGRRFTLITDLKGNERVAREVVAAVAAALRATLGLPAAAAEEVVEEDDEEEDGVTAEVRQCNTVLALCRVPLLEGRSLIVEADSSNLTPAHVRDAVASVLGHKLCSTFMHTAGEAPLAPPLSLRWPAAAPRLVLRWVTGKGGSDVRGVSCEQIATRFSLLAEEPRSGEKRGRAAASAAEECVARALMTYANGEMSFVGPTLELFEVKRRWRRRGLGAALLAAIEKFVTDAVAPRTVDRPCASLSLCNVVGEREFWDRAGFTWLDFGEEAVKRLRVPLVCTCGACGGVLSRRLAEKLSVQADMDVDALASQVEQWQCDGHLRGRQPLPPGEWSDCILPLSMFFPKPTCQSRLCKPLLDGLSQALLAVRDTAAAHVLPTPDAVLQRWAAAHGIAAARNYALLGGSLELVIASVIDVAGHVDTDGMFDWDEDAEATWCEQDHAFDAVRRAALGGAFPALLQGCPDCGLYDEDEDEEW